MAHEKLKIVPQYIKNVSKSTMYASGDVISEIMPGIGNFVSTNSDIMKSISNDLRNIKSIVKQTKNSFDNSDAGKSIRNIKNNFLSDLKTGKLYNKERQNMANLEASGFADVFDMSDFNFDDTTSNNNINTSNINKINATIANSTNSSIKAGAIGTMNAIEANAKAVGSSMMESASMIVENQTAINSTNMVLNQKMFGEINSTLNSIEQSTRGIFMNIQNMNTFYNESMKMYEIMSNSLREISALNKELTEMQRNLYAEYNKSNNKFSEDKNSFIMNGFDIKDYLTSVNKRIKNEYKGSSVGSMTSMFGEDTNLLKILEGSPAKFLINMMTNKIISEPLKNSMKNLDKTATNFFQTLLFKSSSKLKEKGETNDLANMVYKIFGLDLGEKQSVNTAKYIKGPIPYNGYADKAITEVIPTYLRKILATLSGNKEMVYNYETGKFNTISETRKAFEIENNISYGMDEMKTLFKEKLNKYAFSKSDAKQLENTIKDFTKFMVDTGHFYNKSDTYDTLMEQGYSGDINTTNLLLGILKSTNPQKLMELNQAQLNSIQKRKDLNNEINKHLSTTGYGALFNGSERLKTQPLSFIDRYKKSSVDYLRDIRTILLEGIRVFPINMGSNIKTKNNFLDKRMNKYNEKLTTDSFKSSDFIDETDELRNNAKKNNKTILDLFNNKSIDQYSAMFTNDDIIDKVNTERQNTEVGKFINKFTIFKKMEDMKNLSKAAKNIASAPEKAMISLFDAINDNLIYTIYGVKDKNGQTFLDKIVNNVNNATDKATNYILDGIVLPLKKAIFGEKGLVPSLKKRLSPIIEKVKNKDSGFLGKLSNRLFGDLNDSPMSAKDFFVENIKPRLKNTGIGAGIGLITSFMTPLGLVGGTLLGSTLGFASTSDRVKNVLFGELKDGERQGGIISKSIIDKVVKSKKNMGIGAGIGATVGLLTPLGLIGTTLFGGALGFASKLDSVQDALFGKKLADGSRDETTALLSKEWQKKIKDFTPSAIKGTGLGIVGSLFLPVGPIGGAIIGLSTAIGLQSEKIKTYLFGKEDPDLGKRYGGLLGKLTTWVRYEIGNPVKKFVQNTFVDVKHFLQKNVFDKIANAFTPFKIKLQEEIKAGWDSTKTFIGSVFEKHVGEPFSKVMQEKFLDPMKNLFSKLFGTLGKVFSKIFSVPFRALDNKSNSMMDKYKGTNIYNTWKDSKEKRNKITEDKYAKAKAKINGNDDQSEYIRDYLRKNGYSAEAVKQVQLFQQMKKSVDNSSKANELLKEGLGILKDIYSAVSSSVSDSVNEFLNTRKINKRAAEHNKKHNLKTPRVISLFSTLEETRKANADELGQSHAGGLDFVPDDEYNANLHKGEMVIPADEANYLRRILGVPEKETTNKRGKRNNKNSFVNNISKLFGKKDKESKLLFSIDTKVTKIYDLLNKNNSSTIESDNKILKDIRKDIHSVQSNVDGQILNVGYHSEYIANIMTDIFGQPKTLPKGIKAGVHKIKGFFSKIFNVVKKPIDFILKPFKFVGNIATSTIDKINKVITKIIEIPNTIIKGVTKLGTKVLGIVNTTAKGIFNILGQVAKSVPKVIGVITNGINQSIKGAGILIQNAAKGLGKMIQYTTTGLGKLVAGLGSATKSIITAGGKLAKSFIDLSGYLVKTVVKTVSNTTKTIITTLGKTIKSVWDVITSPFTKNKKGVSTNIKNVKNVEIVNRVRLVDRLSSVGTIEKIADKTLYNKIDKLITINDRSHNPNTDINNNLHSPYSKFTEDAQRNIQSKEDTESGISSKFRNKINSINGIGNKQLALFNAKENEEAQTKQFKLRKKLEENALNSEIGTYKLLNNAFGPKGLFGKLGTILTFLLPLLGKLKDKVKNLFSEIGDKLFDKVKNLFGDKFTDILEKLGTKNITNSPSVTGGYGGNSTIITGGSVKSLPKSVIGEINERVGKNAAGKALETGSERLLLEGATAGVAGSAASKGKFGKVTSIFGKMKSKIPSFSGSANKIAAAETTPGITGLAKNADSSIIKKIFSSSTLSKLVGNKISPVLRKVGDFVTKNLSGRVGKSFFAKLAAKWGTIIGSGTVSAGIIPAIWFGGEIINSISATNQIFQMSPDYKPTPLMRLIAGVAEFISTNITFGIISPNSIAEFIAGLVLSDKDTENLTNAKNELQSQYNDYINNGGDQSFTEYNKQVNKSLLGKTWDGIKSGASSLWNGTKDLIGNMGYYIKDGADTMNATIGAIFGLEDSDGNPLNFTEWANKKATNAWNGVKSGVKWLQEKSYSAWEGAKHVWGNISDFIGNIKDNIKDGINIVDENIGSILGLENGNGDNATFSEWAGEKMSNFGKYLKEKVSEAWYNARDLWTNLCDGLQTLKDKAKSGLKSADDNIGSILGLEDSSGNSTSLSGWASSKWDSFSNWASNKWNNFKSSVSSRKRFGAGNGMGTSSSAQELSRKLGAGFGESPEIVNNAAYWRQGDERWGSASYGTASIAASGCGPTSASMLISSVTDSIITPKDAADWSVSHGYRIPGVGTSWDFFPAIGREYGVNLTPTTDQNALKAALQSGRPAILSGQGAVPFTKSGHLIMAVGMDSSGRLIINDPVSKERSTTYDFGSVMSNCAQAWISDKPLKNGISGTSSSSSGGQEQKQEEQNPFLAAIQKLANYSQGFVSDTIQGKVFDASKYDNPSGSSSTDTSGVGGANSTVGDATAVEKVANVSSSQVPGLTSTQLANLNKILPTAVYNFKTTGMLPSLTLGQAMGESSMGTAGVAINGANNNWYGHTKSSLGDGSHGNWDVYSTPARGAASHINWFKFDAYKNYRSRIYGAKNYRDAVQAIQESPYCGDGSDYYSLITSSIASHNLDQWDNGSTAGVPDLGSAGSGLNGTGLDLTLPRALAQKEMMTNKNYKPLNYKLREKMKNPGDGFGIPRGIANLERNKNRNYKSMNFRLGDKMKTPGNGIRPYDASRFVINQVNSIKSDYDEFKKNENNNQSVSSRGIEAKLDILITLIQSIVGNTSFLSNIAQLLTNIQSQQKDNSTSKETINNVPQMNSNILQESDKNNTIDNAYMNALKIARGILS